MQKVKVPKTVRNRMIFTRPERIRRALALFRTICDEQGNAEEPQTCETCPLIKYCCVPPIDWEEEE